MRQEGRLPHLAEPCSHRGGGLGVNSRTQWRRYIRYPARICMLSSGWKRNACFQRSQELYEVFAISVAVNRLVRLSTAGENAAQTAFARKDFAAESLPFHNFESALQCVLVLCLRIAPLSQPLPACGQSGRSLCPWGVTPIFNGCPAARTPVTSGRLRQQSSALTGTGWWNTLPAGE